MKHTKEHLKQLQSLPLEAKIRMTQQRIEDWYNHYDGKVYVSFSGGKDSTVLLHIARSLYPDIEAVFCDTGLEYPEIKKYVKTFENVTIIRPDMNFKEVIDKYGWCFPSKEIAKTVEEYRKGNLNGIKRFQGTYYKTLNQYAQSYIKWSFVVDVPFKISEKCCDVMKKKPFKKYEKATEKKKMLGNMASESLLRRQSWLRYGCNNTNSKQNARSLPLSFWTEQDILYYILLKRIAISSVYGNIYYDQKGKLRCSGESRTGCMFCVVSSHLQKPNRFQRMGKTHPELHKYCMEELGLREFLEYMKIPTGLEPVSGDTLCF